MLCMHSDLKLYFNVEVKEINGKCLEYRWSSWNHKIIRVMKNDNLNSSILGKKYIF